MQPISNSPGPRRRALALVLVFGALAFLWIATATTSRAFVLSLKHDTLDDFAKGKFFWTGLLDMRPVFEGIQLIPAGLVTDWDAESESLPIAVSELAAVSAGGHIVVMGGYDGTNARREVYVNTLDADGHLDVWASQTYSLPQATAGAVAVVYPKPNDADSSWIYLLGGFGGPLAGTGAYDEVYRTTLNHNTGAISAWTATEPLSVPAYYLSASIVNDYIYAVGGYDPVQPSWGSIDQVFYAQINSSTGNLGPWQATELLPDYLHSLQTIGYSDASVSTLYSLGGRVEDTHPSGGDPYNVHDVYFANVNADGSLDPWGPTTGGTERAPGDLPRPIYAHGGTLFNGAILVTGGRRTLQNTLEEDSDLVKAALVDPGESTFRLYNWCGDIPWGECTVGAWQTGEPLGLARVYHVTVSTAKYMYTIGGVLNGSITGSVYRGSVDEESEAQHAPRGHYTSPEIELGMETNLRRLEWKIDLAFPLSQTAELTYRHKSDIGDWSDWSTPIVSEPDTNTHPFSPPVEDIWYFQYRVDFTTEMSRSSPLLDWVELYYEVPDPDVEVRKDTGGVITATTGKPLQYTIYYTNSGGWVAEGVILTETLPEYTIYNGGADWQQIGASNQYTYKVGDLPPKVNGSVSFLIQVADPPETEESITNTVEIDYPTMTDAFGQGINDPEPGNNRYQFSNILELYVIDVEKVADPPAGTLVKAGEKITYTITYKNNGRIAANPAILTDLFTPNTNFEIVSVTPPPNQGDTGWNLDILNPSDEGTIEIVVKITDTIVFPETWELSNQASLSSPQGPVQDSVLVTHMITNDMGLYDIEVVKVADPPEGTEVEPGERITYTITYKNKGRITAAPATLTDVFSPTTHVSIFSAVPAPNPGSTTWNLGTLSADQEGTIELVVELEDTKYPEPWELTNIASLTSPQGPLADSLSVTHIITNREVLIIEVNKLAEPPAGTTLMPGDKVTYTITYKNKSRIAADPAFMTDTVAPHTEVIILSTSPEANRGATGWDLGTLNPNDSGSINLVVQTNPNIIYPGDAELANLATMGSTQGPIAESPLVTHPISNFEEHDFADLVIKNIRWVPANPSPGTPVKFYVTISSEGDIDAGDPFWVELYIKPKGSSPPTMASDHNYGYCLAGTCVPGRGDFVKSVSSLKTGVTFELPAFQGPDMTFTEAGEYDIYAQIDVAWDQAQYHPVWGYYIESKEKNNIMGKTLIVPPINGANCPGICLPLIKKSSH